MRRGISPHMQGEAPGVNLGVRLNAKSGQNLVKRYYARLSFANMCIRIVCPANCDSLMKDPSG
jgi:hypothetical protein